MPIYIESRNLDVPVVGFVAEHQYLVYIPDGQELNYDAWKYIAAFPSEDGSLLTRFGTGDILFKDAAAADQWSIADFLITEVDAVATILGKPLADVTVSDMVAEGFAGTAASFRQRELVNDGGLQSEDDIWTYLVSTADNISGKFTYKLIDLVGTSNNDVFGPTVNSNSFITSLLRHAQVAGKDIGAFDTVANVPGNQTWLGDAGNDTLDANTIFATGDQVTSLFGGKGADTLIGNDSGVLLSPFYLVAGDHKVANTLSRFVFVALFAFLGIWGVQEGFAQEEGMAICAPQLTGPFAEAVAKAGETGDYRILRLQFGPGLTQLVGLPCTPERLAQILTEAGWRRYRCLIIPPSISASA